MTKASQVSQGKAKGDFVIMKTLVQWEKVLAEQVVLPTRNRWSRRAITQYLGISKNTLKTYIEKIAIVVKDFRSRIPRDSKGNFKAGFSLDQYQFWLVVKIAHFAALIRADLNGTSYISDIAQVFAKSQQYVSYEVFLYDNSLHSDAA
jgi:hypothetical protein